MFNKYSEFVFRTDTVRFGNQQTVPGAIEFLRQDGTLIVTIPVKAFQILRRGVHAEYQYAAGTEHKIMLIKTLRELYSMGLKEAKDVVEYFLANYTLDCGKPPQEQP